MIIDINNNKLFEKSKKLESDEVVGIRYMGLAGNENIEEVNFPNLEILEASSFVGCINLKSFYLPAAIKIIKSSTFNGCKNLTYINTSFVETICENAFSDCGIEELDFSNVKNINNFAFTGSKLKSAKIKGAMIAEHSFEYCPELEYAKIEKCKSLEGYVFKDCQNLKKVYLADIRYIDGEIFKNCPNLETVILAGEIESICKLQIPANVNILFTGSKIELDEINFYTKKNLKKRIITKGSLDEMIASGMSIKEANNLMKQFDMIK